ncbi:MAG: NUDIX domain-containing protein [Planctomycetota bacterium]|nr:NUDIX domain-containing protein [Planctomycetota bacterium]
MGNRQLAGAIPFRLKNNKVRFLLVTSTSGSWIFPKGGIEPGDTEQETAKKECQEEAGIVGKVIKRIGIYKKTESSSITFFLLNYRRPTKWVERKRRKRRWCSYKKARNLLPAKQRRLLDKARLEVQKLNK